MPEQVKKLTARLRAIKNALKSFRDRSLLRGGIIVGVVALVVFLASTYQDWLIAWLPGHRSWHIVGLPAIIALALYIRYLLTAVKIRRGSVLLRRRLEHYLGLERLKAAIRATGTEGQNFDWAPFRERVSEEALAEELMDAVEQAFRERKSFDLNPFRGILTDEDFGRVERLYKFSRDNPYPPPLSELFAKEPYELLEMIGRGGFGTVYRGRHKRLKHTVAIKVIDSKRSLREGQAAARTWAPFTVKVHDIADLPDGRSYLVMDFIEGESLNDHIKDGRLPNESQALQWMKECCEAMEDALRYGIVHRDLKPSNILIHAATNEVRVCDFGIAKILSNEHRGTITNHSEHAASGLNEKDTPDTRAPEVDATFTTNSEYLLGTPRYISPEQAANPRDADVRSDIYSFGATFYHLLTAQPPFKANDLQEMIRMHKEEFPVAPSALNPDLSDPMNDLLERCLSKEPDRRFQSFKEILQQLEDMKTGETFPWNLPIEKKLSRHIDQHEKYRNDYLNFWVPEGKGSYELESGRSIAIRCGNITASGTEVLVSSDDCYLTMGGGVSRAIREEGGESIKVEAQKYVPIKLGRVHVTAAGKLKQATGTKYIFHAVTMALRETSSDFDDFLSLVIRPSRDVIFQLLEECFHLAETHDIKTIAFPLLGTGAGQLESGICLDTMMRYLVNKLGAGNTPVREAQIVLWHR